MKDRIASEKDFHNEAFASGTRRSLDKYYSIFEPVRTDFDLRMKEGLAGSRVLECGCGVHAASTDLAGLAEWVTGIDISEEAIRQSTKQARELRLDNCSYMVMNAEDMTFGHHSFDLVYGFAVLHHLDLDRAMPQFVRVLKPGGRFLFMEPLGHNPFIWLYRRLTPAMRTPGERPFFRRDLKLMASYFDQFCLRHYYLFALLAVPFRNARMFRPLLKFLCRIDRQIFRLVPGLRWMAWYVIIDARLKETQSDGTAS